MPSEVKDEESREGGLIPRGPTKRKEDARVSGESVHHMCILTAENLRLFFCLFASPLSVQSVQEIHVVTLTGFNLPCAFL
jgi:hypothetical protein